MHQKHIIIEADNQWPAIFVIVY